MRVGARGAVREDIEELCRLRSRSLEELAGERGGAVLARRELSAISHLEIFKEGTLPSQKEMLLAELAANRHLLALGTIDGSAVGFLQAVETALEESGPVVRIEMLYVEGEAREVGVAEALVDLAKAWSRERGAIGLDALVLPGMRESKNFLESMGFAARLLVMHRPHERDGG
ncbi:MAG: GNAT family N-acetyltransferase [Acidimicrobiales bacterium]